MVYATLIPIIFGVILTTLTEIQFDNLGFALSLFSTFAFAFLNIFVKKVFYLN